MEGSLPFGDVLVPQCVVQAVLAVPSMGVAYSVLLSVISEWLVSMPRAKLPAVCMLLSNGAGELCS